MSYVWEIRLAGDDSFGAMREPSGVAWVVAGDEDEARKLVLEQIATAAIAEIEQYEVSPLESLR